VSLGAASQAAQADSKRGRTDDGDAGMTESSVD